MGSKISLGAVLAVFLGNAYASDIECKVVNNSDFYLQAETTEVVSGGALTDALADLPASSSSFFAANHNWYAPLSSVHLRSKFYLLDNNFNPRELCSIELETARTTLGYNSITAKCDSIDDNPGISQHIHFDEETFVTTDSVVNPHVEIHLVNGPGPDLSRTF